jgi:hypothetical protein
MTRSVRFVSGRGCGSGSARWRSSRRSPRSNFDGFYATRERVALAEDDVLVLSADGKGIVMRPDALRAETAQAAARASPKLKRVQVVWSE